MLEAPHAVTVSPLRKKWQGQRVWPSTMRITAALLLVVFVTISLHGHWRLALAVLSCSVGFWRLNELWHRRRERLAILKNVDAMPYREFVAYAGELLHTQGYSVLSSDSTGGPQADLLLSRGKGYIACWVLHGPRSAEVGMIARAAATVQAYEGWSAMLLASQRLTLRDWCRVCWARSMVVNRDRLARLVVQHRRGHRVITLPRKEKPKLRRRK